MKFALLVMLSLVPRLVAEDSSPHIQAALSAYRAGQVDIEAHKPDEAVSHFEWAIHIEPTFLAAYDRLVTANLAAGHRTEAAFVLTRLLEIEPNNRIKRIQLGQLLLEQNQPKRALAQFALVLQEDPKNAGALAGFIQAATKLGMSNEANEARQKLPNK